MSRPLRAVTVDGFEFFTPGGDASPLAVAIATAPAGTPCPAPAPTPNRTTPPPGVAEPGP